VVGEADREGDLTHRRAILVACHVPRRFLLGCVGVACVVLLLATPALAATPGQLLWVRTYRPASGGASFWDVAAGPMEQRTLSATNEATRRRPSS